MGSLGVASLKIERLAMPSGWVALYMEGSGWVEFVGEGVGGEDMGC